jgi:hypothetical protein
VAFGIQADEGTTPAGLLNGVTPITASTATDHLTAMADDLAAMVAAIGNAGIDPSAVTFVAGPREAMLLATRLVGSAAVSVLMTLGLPAKSVACFANAAVMSGVRDTAIIETSKEVLVHEEASAPAAIGTPGSPNTMAAPARSAFQTDAVSVRVRCHVAWAVVPGGAQVVNNVQW